MKKPEQHEINNKTICFFNTNRAWGGGEKWHLDYARGLQERGYSVCIIAYKDSPLHTKALEAGIRVFGLKLNNLSFLNFFHLGAIRKILKETGTAVVLFNLARDLKAGGRAAKQLGIPRRIYRRGSAIPVKNTFLNRYIFKNIVTEIISNSEATTKTLTCLNPTVAENKITVLYNGIDTGRFPPVEKKIDPGRPVVIGNAGRLSPQKAQHHLIELAEQLKSKGIDFTIRVAGDGDLHEELAGKTKHKGLQDCVLWEGFVSDIKKFLTSIDVFILTSHWEGFGYVLIEAMLCGLPVIAFDVSSNPEIVKNNETGYLIPPYEIDTLVEAVKRLRSDPTKAREMGRKGRDRALELFDFQKSLDRLEDILRPTQL